MRKFLVAALCAAFLLSTASLVSGQPGTISYLQVRSFPTGKIAGRSTTGTGTLEALTVGSGLTLSGGILSASSTATTNASLLTSGTLDCARTPAYTGDVTKPQGSCATTVAAVNAANINSGTLPVGRLPAFSGDATSSANNSVLTLATVNSSVGSFGSSTQCPVITVNSKGLITDISTVACAGSATLAGLTDTAVTSPAKGNILVYSSATNKWTNLGVGGNGTCLAANSAVTLGVEWAACGSTTTDASLLTSGTLAAGRLPAFTGDITTSAGSSATTLATVNSNVGTFGSSTNCPTFTVNGKGLVTAASQTACAGGGGSSTYASLTDVALTSVAKGAIPAYNATSSKWNNLAVGNDNQCLTADSTQTLGVKWGGCSGSSSGGFSGALLTRTSTYTSFPASTYTDIPWQQSAISGSAVSWSSGATFTLNSSGWYAMRFRVSASNTFSNGYSYARLYNASTNADVAWSQCAWNAYSTTATMACTFDFGLLNITGSTNLKISLNLGMSNTTLFADSGVGVSKMSGLDIIYLSGLGGSGSGAPIYQNTLPSSQTSITIPVGSNDSLQNLNLRASVKSTATGASLPTLRVTFNSDTTATNYRGQSTDTQGAGSTVRQNSAATASILTAAAYVNNATYTSTMFSNFRINIFDYKSTAKAKQAIWDNSWSADFSTDFPGRASGMGIWNSTAAITSITLTLSSGDFAAGSSFILTGDTSSSTSYVQKSDSLPYTTNLNADFRLTESTGQTISDSSGNGYTGTLGTTSSAESNYDPVWVGSNSRPMGLYFSNGSAINSRVTLSSLNVFSGTGGITMFGLVRYYNGTVGNQYIFGQSQDETVLLFREMSAGYAARLTVKTSSGVKIVDGSTPINDRQWHRIIGRFVPGTGVQIWVDGIQENQTTTTDTTRTAPSTGSAWLGWGGANPITAYNNAIIARAGIYSEALSDDRLQLLDQFLARLAGSL